MLKKYHHFVLNNVQLVSLYAYRLRSVDKRHREAATNGQNGTVNAVQLNIAFDKKRKAKKKRWSCKDGGHNWPSSQSITTRCANSVVLRFTIFFKLNKEFNLIFRK